MVTGSAPLQSTTVATAGWPLVSGMKAAMSCLPAAGQGWNVVTPLMGTFLATAGHQMSFEIMIEVLVFHKC